VRTTFAGFDYDFENRPGPNLTPDQRTQVLEKYWNDGSLSMWLATFPEMFFDEAVSAVVSDFVRDKMRKRLRHDPKLCDLLIFPQRPTTDSAPTAYLSRPGISRSTCSRMLKA